MRRRRSLIFIAPLALLGIGLFILVGGFIVMQLWNWLLPSLFGWHTLTLWQALGILALCRILFGGFGGAGHSHIRRRMEERWGGMTPEERERFREGMRRRFGLGSTTPESEEL